MSNKIKYQLEFPVKASPQLLYEYFTSPSGLSEWFADNVNSRGEKYTFIWDDSEEEAKLLVERAYEKAKYKWLEDEGTDYFFEFRIIVDEITKDVSLVITDFAEEDEVEEAKMLWENQIDALRHILGA
ncbi:START-like domain-containing protein [Aureivirga marina]|uniref:START-like domain-containing protein n=1 Tax=Aureivirga marina TaxID=1182451 RepID=UPI0018C9CFDC|nr:START-like domain-containing protein [Aureivirga marina]